MPVRNQNDNTLVITSGSTLRVVKNMRMRRGVLLLAEALVNPDFVGITHLALGSGIGNGTLMLPEAPNEDMTQLRQEQVRVPIDSVSFADLDNAVGDTIADGERSNRIDYTTEVDPDVSQFLITEAALFGGTGAGSPNGGTMFACVSFPVNDNRPGGQNPDAPDTIRFTWRIALPHVNPEELRKA